jgi:uncharacterized membrane protein
MFKTETGQLHSATWVAIICGIISVVCIAGVAWGKLPETALTIVVTPIIAILVLFVKSNGQKNGG